MDMVTCTKCGTRNLDEAKFCVNCGADLASAGGERRGGGDSCFGRQNRREDECFGLPNGGAVVGLIIGIIIIIFGLSNLLGWRIDFGPLLMIVVGVLIAAGAIYGMTRRR